MRTSTSTRTRRPNFKPEDDVVILGYKGTADERDMLADLAWEQRTSRSALMRRFMREGLERAGKLATRETPQNDEGTGR